MECPNCSSNSYYTRFSGGMRCSFCGYNSEFPHIRPEVKPPMERVDVNSADWREKVAAYVAKYGYTCCGSKVANEHKIDCPDRNRNRRGVTYGT